MKRFIIAICIIALASCSTKKPEDKASELIEKWMEKNHPNTSYKTTRLFIPIRFTKTEEETLYQLKVNFETSRYVDVLLTTDDIQIKDKEIDGRTYSISAQNKEKLVNVILNNLHREQELAHEKIYDLYDEFKATESLYIPKTRGEKGFTKTIAFKDGEKEEQITFSFDPKVSKIRTAEPCIEDTTRIELPVWESYAKFREEQAAKEATEDKEWAKKGFAVWRIKTKFPSPY